ncbi:expressed unknown protein [Seminavis robusta]|uniref:Uncharacterized protein n=1 Tax=Seminavis robusta TaxID=568900 RepID=A0A9N8HFF2_9STRA|nr:expressed unknown protein [Seminavis robusta]|eukprot:Sro433_g141790.1 n/a (380) ;mRNA; r:17646-18785
MKTYFPLFSPFALLACLRLQTVASFDDFYFPDHEEEWRMMSQNGTRRVFNFGIGSLSSWASRQTTATTSPFDSPPSIAPAFPGAVGGLVREFGIEAYGACFNWAPATVRPCFPDFEDCSAPVTGFFFEIFEEEWKSLRDREDIYDLLEVSPNSPRPEGLDPDGYYFTWASRTYDPREPACANSPDTLVSQAYWDSIIAGIMAWDGQLLNSGRYTWDLMAELEETPGFASKVHQSPSLSLEERRNLAVELVKSTKQSVLQWVDDRRCPLNGNTIITPISELSTEVLEEEPIEAAAIGTVSPPFSDAFHAFIDEILIEGGWEFGALNSIHNRMDACTFVDPNGRGDWTTNLYYDDFVGFWTVPTGLEESEVTEESVSPNLP